MEAAGGYMNKCVWGSDSILAEGATAVSGGSQEKLQGQ